MSVTETGYQNYEMYNVTDTNDGDSGLSSFQVANESTSTRVLGVNASTGQTIELVGQFSIQGGTLAQVDGTMSSVTVSKNGGVFFSDAFSSGAGFQNWVNSYSYNLSLLGGNDKFTGTSAEAINDAVQTLDGNDVFTGYGDTNGYSSSGGDHFYGGNGIDTSVYRGTLSQYSIQRDVSIEDARTDYTSSNLGKIVTDNVANRDGVDKLVDVERLSFSDVNVAYDTAKGENAGEAYRIYKAAFDRAPDADGLGFWVDALDHGASLTSVAQGFINSAEFTKMYGSNPTDAQFVTELYNHVLHRAPEGAGYQFWLDSLSAGVSRAQVLADFSESAENINQTNPLIANGIQYQEYGDLG